MKILLIDIDSKIPNLALKKVEKHHLDKGDKVIKIKKDVEDMKLSCLICKDEHKATSENFPLVSHRKVKNKKGQIEDRVVGYICIKCCRKQIKHEKQERITHSIPKMP